MDNEKNYKLDLNKTTLDSLTTEEQATIKQLCVTIAQSSGFLPLMSIIKNRYVHETIYLNRGDISNHYFIGTMDCLSQIEDFIKQTALFEIEQSTKK